MNDEKIIRLTIDAAFRIDDGTLVADAVSYALRALAAGYEVEVKRLKAEIERLKGEFDDRELIEDNCKLRERLAAATTLIEQCSRGTNAHPYCPGCGHVLGEVHGSWCPMAQWLAQSPARESAKSCQLDADGRCEWHTHQLGPDVTASHKRADWERAVDRSIDRLDARIRAIEPAFRTKPVPEPPLVTDGELKIGDAVMCEHANECPGLCPCPAGCYCKSRTCRGLPESRRHKEVDGHVFDASMIHRDACRHRNSLMESCGLPESRHAKEGK